ncbi:MAG: hypothetical protein DRZ76_03020 [Candidatus Nealsonbacteria bacterium]|nr:MAG: hypothetical protein DRZ76_03020 [Candidatus Nealsonbacteria bacterium]
MPNKFKYLIFLIPVALVLLLPQPAFAIFGTGLFDLFDQMLGGVEELTARMVQLIFLILFLYLTGLSLLWISSNWLESFIYQQSDWLIQLEEMTQAGWSFVSGLANMLLVIIFLIIIFAFIFKIETLKARKSLPYLIAVALLINFSLLFVYILVDISQIIYNTILNALPDNLWTTAMNTLIEPLASIGGIIIALIAVLAGLWAVPIANAFAQVVFASLFTVLFLPNLIMWIVQIIFFWSLAIMLFAFIILFGARVFVIQLLAILAPLAFLCLILPQTRKLWSQWLNILVEWLLLGIFFLFFLGLGFSFLTLLKPNVGKVTAIIPGLAWAHIGEIIIYYFVLLIYLMIVIGIGKKFIPQGAQGVIKFVEGVAQMAATGGIKPATRRLARAAETRAYRAQTERARRRKEEAQRIAAEMKAQNRPITLRERLKTGVWTRRPTPEKVFEAGKRAEVREKRLKETALAREIERVKGWGPGRQNDELLRQQKAVMKNFERIAAIVQQQAEKGKIGPEAEKLIKEAVKGGANPDLILARRPDLATTLGKNIKDVMDKIDAKTFREKTQVEAMRHPEVIKNFLMDGNKFDEFTKNASRATKAAIKEGFVANAPQLKPNQFPSHYQAAVKDRLTKMFKTSPRWQTK